MTGYKVFRNGTQLTTVTGTTYQNTGLAASTAYSYTVAAYDAAGNTSAQSTSVSATTQAAVVVTRDPLKWPFAQNSIWNMPIGSGAQYVPANLPIK